MVPGVRRGRRRRTGRGEGEIRDLVVVRAERMVVGVLEMETYLVIEVVDGVFLLLMLGLCMGWVAEFGWDLMVNFWSRGKGRLYSSCRQRDSTRLTGRRLVVWSQSR